jgi:thioredoxin-related protein
MKSIFLLTLLIVTVSFAGAQTPGDSKMVEQPPQSADEIVLNACKHAAKENKNVLVMFHASWCVWCHKMDSSMNDKSCKKFFDDNYVVAHLVVMESPQKKNLENPAAMELLTRYNGADQGIPFWVVIDKDGNLLADCLMKPEASNANAKVENIGCPATEKEVNAFIQVLKKTSKISTEQEVAIIKRFRQNDQH